MHVIAVHPTLDVGAVVLESDAPWTSPPLGWSGDLLGVDVGASSVVGYGAPSGDVRRCLRVAEQATELGFDPFDRTAPEIDVTVRGSVCKGDSGTPLITTVEGQSLVIGVLSELGVEANSCGTFAKFVRLSREDPWVIEVTGTEAVRIPCPPNVSSGPQAEALDCP